MYDGFEVIELFVLIATGRTHLILLTRGATKLVSLASFLAQRQRWPAPALPLAADGALGRAGIEAAVVHRWGIHRVELAAQIENVIHREVPGVVSARKLPPCLILRATPIAVDVRFDSVWGGMQAIVAVEGVVDDSDRAIAGGPAVSASALDVGVGCSPPVHAIRILDVLTPRHISHRVATKQHDHNLKAADNDEHDHNARRFLVQLACNQNQTPGAFKCALTELSAAS